jgi:hypothetical protein
MLLWFEPKTAEYTPVAKTTRIPPKGKSAKAKPTRKRQRQGSSQAPERICKQLTRLMMVSEKLRSAGELSLSELEQMDPDTGSRTYRRDLAVLTRLDWCEPTETPSGKTVWKWTKDV